MVALGTTIMTTDFLFWCSACRNRSNITNITKLQPRHSDSLMFHTFFNTGWNTLYWSHKHFIFTHKCSRPLYFLFVSSEIHPLRHFLPKRCWTVIIIILCCLTKGQKELPTNSGTRQEVPTGRSLLHRCFDGPIRIHIKIDHDG